jgi:hypothetical protein
MTRDEALEDAFDRRHETGTLNRVSRSRDRYLFEGCRNCRFWSQRIDAEGCVRSDLPRVCEVWALIETRAACHCDRYQPIVAPGSVLGEKGPTRG